MKINIKEKIANSTAVDISALIGIFVVAVLVVNPLGDFPLNDDWSFARTVKRLIDLHMYVPTGWTAMSLLTNVLWGWLFCIPSGFSFNALRISTLVAAVMGIVGVYFSAKELRLGRGQQIVAGLVLAFNPIFFALSNTFMTDVLFSSLLVISTLFFLRFFTSQTIFDLMIATAAALAATMSRQLGIALPLAFAFSYILFSGFNVRSFFRGFFPVLFCSCVLLGYQHWLAVTGRMPPLYASQNERVLELLRSPGKLILSEVTNAYKVLLYYGLFLLPGLVGLCTFAFVRKIVLERIKILFAIIFVGMSTYVFYRHFGLPRIFPMLGNILGRFGIGPLSLRDTYILRAETPELSSVFWWFLIGLALIGATLIVFAFVQFLSESISELRRKSLSQGKVTVLFLWLSTIIYFSVVFMTEVADRYLLPALALLTLATLASTSDAGNESHYSKIAALSLCMAFAIFSVGATRDYLTWNRLRWQALNDLTEVQKVEVENIDGGFEFNAFLLYDRSYRPQRNKSWWWVDDDTYVISFNPIPGYTAIKEYPYSHWLPRYESKILVLKRVEF